MKKLAASLALAGLLAACNVTVVVPGPAPGTPVTVDDPDGAQATLAPNQTHRFELTVGADPVRVDVKHQEGTADGELYVRVFDHEDTAYAHTDRRDLFARAGAALTSLGVNAQDVDVSFPYSVNLPKNMGKVYVEVTNKTDVSAEVTVKAVTRNEVVRDSVAMEAPPSNASLGYKGAVLFLGQRDSYVYEGTTSQQISFTPADAANPVKLKAVRNPELPGDGMELLPGGSYDLLPGDKVEVFAEGDACAGFCHTLNGCADYIVTGEYELEIH